MANAYIHNSVLSNAQVQSILHDYTHFEPATQAAERIGVSRQTTSSLYLKFSRRLHELRGWDRTTPDAAQHYLMNWISRTEIREAYDRYLHGPPLAAYRAARAGAMLSPEEYEASVVAQELKSRWGKIAEKAFAYHYALIWRTAESRINWMQMLGTGDVAAPTIVQLAARQVFNDLERSFKQRPLGRDTSVRARA